MDIKYVQFSPFLCWVDKGVERAIIPKARLLSNNYKSIKPIKHSGPRTCDHYSLFYLLKCHDSHSWTNSLGTNKYGRGSNIRQHQWLLCQALAKTNNQIQMSWPMFGLLIGAKSTFIFSQVLRTSPYLWLKSWTEELICDLPNRGYEISDLTTYQQTRKRGDHTWDKQRGIWKAPHPTQYIYRWSGMMFWNLQPQNIEVREKKPVMALMLWDHHALLCFKKNNEFPHARSWNCQMLWLLNNLLQD
jgi:hypothetical protein